MLSKFRNTLRLSKKMPGLGIGLFTAVLIVVLSACGPSVPRSDGTNYDAAALGTPVSMAQPAGDYVALWILNGTPTHTPTPNPTDVAVWATINAQTPTIPPLNTLPPVGSGSANTSANTTGASAQATQAPASGDMAGMDMGASTQAAAPASAGDPAKGKEIFTGVGGCFACHDVQNGVVLVGPSLQHVAGVSIPKHAKSGQTPEEYLHQSIVAPNDFVVDGFAAGIMPQNFSQTLTPEQINDVIAYLLTLK